MRYVRQTHSLCVELLSFPLGYDKTKTKTKDKEKEKEKKEMKFAR